MKNQTIHRRDDGTVDIDFYRARAAHERSVLLRLTARKLSRAVRKAVAATVTWLTPPHRPLPDPGALMLMAGAAVRHPKV